MCDRISTWLKDAAVENGPIPLGARALATRMRDLGTGSCPAGYKLVRRAPHGRKGLALDRNEAQTKRPSPNDRRVGIRIRTFEACSGFTLLRPIGSLSSPRPPSSQGSDPASYPAEPPASFRTNRQLSG